MRSMAGRIALNLLAAALAASPMHAFDGCRAVDLIADGQVDQADLEALASANDTRGDLDGSGARDAPDTAIVESWIGTSCTVCPADLDHDGTVCEGDRIVLEAAFGRDCRADLNRDGHICPRDGTVFDAYAQNPSPLSAAAARADLDDDGDVDADDRTLLESRTHPGTDCRMDFNRDGQVDRSDSWFLVAAWGPCLPATEFASGPPFKDSCDSDPPIR